MSFVIKSIIIYWAIYLVVTIFLKIYADSYPEKIVYLIEHPNLYIILYGILGIISIWLIIPFVISLLSLL